MQCLQVLLALSVAPSVASALRWSVVSASCAGGGAPYSNLSVDVTCNGGSSNSCAMGDTALVQGNLYATSSFNDAAVTLQACVLSYCPEVASLDAGTLCEDWLTPTADQECGASGTYTVSYAAEIPQNDDIPTTFYWFVRNTVSIKMIVGSGEDCDDQTEAAYSLSYSMAGFAGLALMGAATYSSRRKRHDGDDGSGDEPTSRFVEMGELAVV